jgi:myo-inositol-1(or 4)-monophosphatase
MTAGVGSASSVAPTGVWSDASVQDTDPVVLEQLAVAIARETAALAVAVRERVVRGEHDTKSSATDVVTEADTACEALVRERLAAARPDDLVLGEEGGTTGTPAPGQVRWVVDPIDGTVNYTRGLPFFSVSLGAEVDGCVVAGAVVEPVSGRVWRAARGHGAHRDDEPLRASGLDDLGLAVIGTGLNYDPERRSRQAAVVARIAARIGDVRRLGCASLDLCAVAAGWLDGFYEHGLHRWDVAAGSLVAEEAGALVRLPGADPDGLGPTATVAAGPALLAPLTALLVAEGAGAIA